MPKCLLGIISYVYQINSFSLYLPFSMSGLPCPDCFKGTKHIGNPWGTTVIIHGIPTYIVSPPDGVTPKGIVVHITDAFGWEFVNNRNLCDHYAERGEFLVYMPDFMNGHHFHGLSSLLSKTRSKAASLGSKLSTNPSTFCKPFPSFSLSSSTTVNQSANHESSISLPHFECPNHRSRLTI